MKSLEEDLPGAIFNGTLGQRRDPIITGHFLPGAKVRD